MLRIFRLSSQWRGVVLLMLVLTAGGAWAANHTADLYPFDDPGQRERYWRLTGELRCLVCQNQTIAESNADLAKDIRDLLYQQIRAGASDAQALDFIVSRYGEWVLFRPRLRAATLLLWAGPLLLGAAGLLVLWLLVRRTARRPETQALNEAERERLQLLLNDTQGSSHP